MYNVIFYGRNFIDNVYNEVIENGGWLVNIIKKV